MSSRKAGIFPELKSQARIDLECASRFERAALFTKVAITPAAGVFRRTGMAFGLL